MEPTSPSSPGLEDSTSPSSSSDTDASPRSNGTPTQLAFSNDTGPTSPDGETSTGSAATVTLTSSSEDSPVSQPAPQDGAREPRTIAGSGPSSPVWLASWDRDTSSWRTSQVSLLSTEDERFPRSWERWPTSGMTRDGQAFALPMSERPTAASDSSSLHTPTTGDSQPNYDHRASPGYVRAKPVPNLHAQIDELLPTPRVSDTNGKGKHGDGGPDLRTSVGELTNPPSEGGKP